MVKVLPTVVAQVPTMDLHLHSSTSDGHLAHTALVALAKAHDVRVAALTDHDDTAGVRDPVLRRFLDALGPAAPQLVPGVEISCSIAPLVAGATNEVHIIGLGVNPNHPALRKALIKQRLGIDGRLRAVCARLQAAGYDVRFQELGRTAGLKFPNQSDLARLLVAKGYAADKKAGRALVDRHMPADHELRLPYTMQPAEAIALIHQAGGAAVLAHPHRNVPNHDPEALRRLFDQLKALGLDAAECYRHDLAVERHAVYRAMIEEAGLLPSGGSDFHHVNHKGKGRHPGDAGAPVELFAPLAERIRARGGCLDVRELEVAVHPQANAAERLALKGRGRPG